MEVPAVGSFFNRFISTRHLIVVLGFTGIAIVQGLMICLPIAMLSTRYWMTLIDSNRFLRPYERHNSTSDWNMEQLGIVYSSYFCGHLLSTQLTGLSRITRAQFSPKWVMFFSVTTAIVCTLLTPLTADCHYYLLAVLRFIMGVAGGITLPILKVMLSKWTLPDDRSKMRKLFHKSTLLGFVVYILLSAFASSDIGGVGFEWFFYIVGGLSLIWCLFWVVWAQDSAQQQPFISLVERELIVTALENDQYVSKEDVPWQDVISSKPFLAILVADVCCNWGLYMLLFQLPIYMLYDLFGTIEISIIISMSLLGSWLFNLGLSKMLNRMEKKEIISKLCARKIATAMGTVLTAILLLMLVFSAQTWNIWLILIVLIMISTGGMYYGFYSNYYDIAPNYADKLTDVTETIAIIPRILVPLFIAGTTYEYCKICSLAVTFCITAVIYLIAFIVYCVYASVEEQPWNKINEKDAANTATLMT